MMRTVRHCLAPVACAAIAIAFVLSAASASEPADALIGQARALTRKATKIRLKASRGRFTWSGRAVAASAHIFRGRRWYAPNPISKAQSDPESNLHRAFEAEGWVDVPGYAADGPYGTVFGYRKDTVTCVCDITWSPGHEDTPGLTEEEEARREAVPHLYRLRESCFAR